MITLIHNDNNKDDNSNNSDNDNDNHNNSNSNNYHHHSVTGWLVRWMEEILHQLRLVVSLSHDFQGFIHPRWLAGFFHQFFKCAGV